MSDLPSVLQKIQTEGTRFRSAVSESLIQQLGGVCNYFYDYLDRSVTVYTTPGSYTWVCPDSVLFVIVQLRAGSGGGGGSSASYGGGGGAGSAPIVRYHAVTPGASYTVTVGAAGTGGAASTDGGNGGVSAFGSSAYCKGGRGGKAGLVADGIGGVVWPGIAAGSGGSSGGSGDDSIMATAGAGFGSGGGGGGAGEGDGGNGTSGSANGSPGTSGGGGGGAGPGNHTGGAGTAGYVYLFY